MKKILKTLLSLFILVLVALVVFNKETLFKLLDKKETRPIVSLKKEFLYDRTNLKDVGKNTIFAKGKRYYYHDGKKLNAFNTKGEKVWSRNFLKDITLYQDKRYLVVSEKEKGNIYQIDNSGKVVSSIIGLGPLKEVINSSSSSISVVKKDTNELVVFNSQMKETAKIKLPSGALLSVDANSSRDRIIILTVDEDAGNISSMFYVYDYSGKFISSKKVSELGINAFINAKEFVIIYSTGLSNYDDSLKRITEYIALKTVMFTKKINDKIIVVSRNDSKKVEDDNYYFYVYSILKKKLEIEARVDKPYQHISYNNGLYFAYNQTDYDILNSSGTVLYSGKNTLPIEKAYMIDDSMVMIVDESSITVYRIEY